MSVDYSAQYGVGYKVEIKEDAVYWVNGIRGLELEFNSLKQ